MYWFIRLLVLTDPASPRDAIEVKADTLAQSIAILDDTGEVIGGALNETMPRRSPPNFRRADPFLDAVLAFVEPVFELLGAQDAEALQALSVTYPEFGDAHAAGRVGHHFMVARSDALPKADAFELVASTAAHYRTLGHAFVVTEATSQWTGAACETLGADPRPFRAVPSAPDRAAERGTVGGHRDEPRRFPLEQGQRQHALRDSPRLAERNW